MERPSDRPARVPGHQRPRRRRGDVQGDAEDGEHADGDGNVDEPVRPPHERERGRGGVEGGQRIAPSAYHNHGQ
eukprot:31145-Pelagococcus_subviridis.AAC.8